MNQNSIDISAVPSCIRSGLSLCVKWSIDTVLFSEDCCDVGVCKNFNRYSGILIGLINDLELILGVRNQGLSNNEHVALLVYVSGCFCFENGLLPTLLRMGFCRKNYTPYIF